MRKLQVILKVIISTISVSAILFGIYSFVMGSIFKIDAVQVELDHRASVSYIFPKIKESLDTRFVGLFGQYVWKVDLEKILKTVESDLRIKEAKVTRVLPNKIHISVSPFTPVANILGNKTSVMYPVARDGEVLPAVYIAEAPDCAILRGEIFMKDRSLRIKAIELLLTLSEEGSISQKNVSEIYFDKKKGFQLRLIKTGSEVWMGFDNFETRVSQAQRVVNYLETEQLSGRIIDARYSKKVVVKLRNEP